MQQQKIIVQDEPRGASELIEITIASGAAGQVNLPDIPQLRNNGDEIVIIKAIRLITAKVLSKGPTTGATTAALADLIKMSLIIYSQGWEKGHLIPVLVLNDAQDSDATTATTIPFRSQSTRLANWVDVDWNKSKIQFSNGTTASQACVLILEVEYQRFLKRNNEYVPVQA